MKTFPTVCGRIPACDWPAIPSDVGAQSLALLYQLQHSEWLQPEAVQAAQFLQLRRLFADVMQTMPLWKERLEAAGYRAGMPVDAAVLRVIPVLTRAEVQQLGEQLFNRELGSRHGGIHQGQTSGSTGRPVKYLQTDLTMLFWRVLTLREHLWQRREFTGKLAAIPQMSSGVGHRPGGRRPIRSFRPGRP